MESEILTTVRTVFYDFENNISPFFDRVEFIEGRVSPLRQTFLFVLRFSSIVTYHEFSYPTSLSLKKGGLRWKGR